MTTSLGTHLNVVKHELVQVPSDSIEFSRNGQPLPKAHWQCQDCQVGDCDPKRLAAKLCQRPVHMFFD